MGLQITVLLTMVIYVEILQSNIPVFDTYGNSPLILIYYIVTIMMICFCLLLSTHTLFVYHVNEYESKNFSRTEAKISLGIAKVLNFIYRCTWQIDPPKVVLEICNHPTDDIHCHYEHDDLHLCFQFYADMINRVAFHLVTLVQVITMFTTLVPTWAAYHRSD